MWCQGKQGTISPFCNTAALRKKLPAFDTYCTYTTYICISSVCTKLNSTFSLSHTTIKLCGLEFKISQLLQSGLSAC